MSPYCIVQKGGQPGAKLNANCGPTCLEWLTSSDKNETEVIEVTVTGAVIRRLPPSESETIARQFQNPKIR
jgi:hypothetical protein